MYCIHTPLHTYTVNIASFKRGITKEASRGASVVSSTCGGGGGRDEQGRRGREAQKEGKKASCGWEFMKGGER